ncbi:2622_t:CDS:2 [Cetraspora pellucida]|uniref:2622_t:CDS:1 n=1 Tax=Cetraspora pellucida TaxID=1433469 RepID=A0ACA9KLM8_9GLOM|nr:2622_t:CDS:2 [Cetraspora pellucida]
MCIYLLGGYWEETKCIQGTLDESWQINNTIRNCDKNYTFLKTECSLLPIALNFAKLHMSSLIKSNAQIRPSLEAFSLPAVANTLMLPLSAYIFLILLIIAVMWFMRRTWNIGRLEAPLLRRPEGATLKGHKKSDQLRDMWIG